MVGEGHSFHLFGGDIFVIILMNEFIARKTRVNTWLVWREILFPRNINFRFGLLRETQTGNFFSG